MANRHQVMTRAWEIFRQTYNYPATPFASIGRRCFASALSAAWQEAREAASRPGRIAAIPTDARAARIADLQRQDALAPMAHDTPAIYRCTIMSRDRCRQVKSTDGYSGVC